MKSTALRAPCARWIRASFVFNFSPVLPAAIASITPFPLRAGPQGTPREQVLTRWAAVVSRPFVFGPAVCARRCAGPSPFVWCSVPRLFSPPGLWACHPCRRGTEDRSICRCARVSCHSDNVRPSGLLLSSGDSRGRSIRASCHLDNVLLSARVAGSQWRMRRWAESWRDSRTRQQSSVGLPETWGCL